MTAAPLWVAVVFQKLMIFWPPVKVNPTVQDVHATVLAPFAPPRDLQPPSSPG